MAPLSAEEENYVRLALLSKGVTPRAVRTCFDREFPPTSLPSTLNKSYNTLCDLKRRRIINQAQWDLLIPPGNGVPDSNTFDVTLMICLIRNLTVISPPINGFDNLPPPLEITLGSDLARIKHYRNELAHRDSYTIDTAYFDTAWREISDAVRRLGGQTMYQECQELKVKILDQSNKEIILEIKQSLEQMKELKLTVDNLGTEHSKVTENIEKLQSSHSALQTSHTNLQTSNSNLQTELSNVVEIVKDPIPVNIKECIKTIIEDWEKKDKMFVSTRASDKVKKDLQDNSCLTLTGPSGVGKSFIARHTALLLKKEGYTIIPVYSPTDIRDYYQPGYKTVFIVDDICGNFTANQQQIANWKQLLPVIKTIIADKCCKIIVSCRLQVYKDEKFNILSPFKTCECNLISDKLGLTSTEKTKIAEKYIGTGVKDIDDLSRRWEFFPLLCCLYREKGETNVKEFFKNPFNVYKDELDKLREDGDEGKNKLCSLVFCVLFNNQLNEKWFTGKMTDEQRKIITDTCEACELNIIPKAKLKKVLDTLDGTFICKQNSIYRTVHDKLFDFLAHFFGQNMIQCFIDHGDSGLVHERFIWQTSPDDKKSDLDFTIQIPDYYLQSYLERLIKDWSAGNVSVVFNNGNLKVSSFRHQLLQNLQHLDQSQQVALSNTKDTVIPREDYGSGTTPLMLTCYYGYTDIVMWLLQNDVDVDQCRVDGKSGLHVASEEGHTDIVKLLLEKNSNADLCDNDGRSPLYVSSQKGHTDIVKLLLEKNSNADRCDNDGRSPLYVASEEGHTNIVKLLLEKNSNADLCDNDGRSPLYVATYEEQTDIVKLLLEKNSNADLCDNDGRSPLYVASEEGHTDIVKLLLERNANVVQCDNDNKTPLNVALSTDIVKLLLLKNNPNVEVCDDDGWTPLFLASEEGHTDKVKLLLENIPNVNLIDIHGCSLLYKASQNGHTEIVKLLLEKNPNVDLCDDEGRTALFEASNEGHTDIVKLLLEKNPNVDQCDNEGLTPLHMASRDGHTDIVKLLLERNANVDLCDNRGVSSLYEASDNGHTDIVKLLLEKNPNEYLAEFGIEFGFPPLYTASENGHTDIVKLLLEKNPEVNIFYTDCWTFFYLESDEGHDNNVKFLLERNPNINIWDNESCSPLYTASQKEHTDKVRLLLEKNPKIATSNDDDYMPIPIHRVHQNRHLKKVSKLLLEKNPNLDLWDDDGWTLLYVTSNEGHANIIKSLLERNTNIEIYNTGVENPLYTASQQGHTEIVKLLLEKGFNVDLCNEDGCSCLYMASQKGDTDIVKLLLDRNPNVDLCDNDGCSSLYIASKEGNIEVVKLLLERNPNVDLCDNDGCSPLYIASKEGNIEIVRLLLEKNPKVDLCNSDGCSPLHTSSQNGHTEIVKLLLEKDSRVDLCNKDGCSPLYTASQNRHTEIENSLSLD